MIHLNQKESEKIKWWTVILNSKLSPGSFTLILSIFPSPCALIVSNKTKENGNSPDSKVPSENFFDLSFLFDGGLLVLDLIDNITLLNINITVASSAWSFPVKLEVSTRRKSRFFVRQDLFSFNVFRETEFGSHFGPQTKLDLAELVFCHDRI